MNEVDWDRLIGYWLKDVLYIWVKLSSKYKGKNQWKDYGRIYLVSYKSLKNRNLKPSGISDDVFYIIENDCDSRVMNYFMVTKLTNPFIYELYTQGDNKIKLNGKSVYFPRRIIDVINEAKMFGLILYNSIDTKLPKEDFLDEWKNNLLQTYQPKTKLKFQKMMKKSKTPQKEISISRNIYSVYKLLWFLDLVEKSKDVCIVSSNLLVKTPGKGKMFITPDILQIYIKDNQFENITILESDKKIWRHSINKCMKNDNKKIIININLNYQFIKNAHANLMIIDNVVNSKDIYIFDPHGKSQYAESIKAYKKIIEYLGIDRDENGDEVEWNIIPSGDWCPVASFQSLEYLTYETTISGDFEGFCETWTAWIVYLIIKNADVPIKDIIYGAIQKLSKKYPEFRDFIRRYVIHIGDIGKDILENELGIHTDVENLTKEDINKLMLYVQEIYSKRFGTVEEKFYILFDNYMFIFGTMKDNELISNTLGTTINAGKLSSYYDGVILVHNTYKPLINKNLPQYREKFNLSDMYLFYTETLDRRIKITYSDKSDPTTVKFLNSLVAFKLVNARFINSGVSIPDKYEKSIKNLFS